MLRLITRLNVGGPARHVGLLHEGLTGAGFECRLAVGQTGRHETPLPVSGSVALPALRRNPSLLRDPLALRQVIKLIRHFSPDIVHTHTTKAGALGRVAAARTSRPLTVHTFHGHVLDGYFSRATSSVITRMEVALAKRTSALVAISSRIRDDLFDAGIGDEHQWHVIPLGLELGPLLSLDRTGHEDRSPVVGLVGRLTAIKDPGTFIEVASDVSKALPDTRFVVAGDGELRGELERRARDSGVRRITFCGWTDDLRSLYASLDIVVLPSLNEGTPAALIEASAAGLPIVATEVGGVSEVVVDGRTGVLTGARDIEQMARAVTRLASNASLRRRFGMAGREHVRHRFSAERLVRDVATLYDELLGRRDGPANGGPGFRAGGR